MIRKLNRKPSYSDTSSLTWSHGTAIILFCTTKKKKALGFLFVRVNKIHASMLGDCRAGAEARGRLEIAGAAIKHSPDCLTGADGHLVINQ